MTKRVLFVMCLKHTCDKKINCYRYRARPDPDQSYDEYTSLCNEADEYRYFARIRDDDEIVELNSDNNTEIKALKEGEPNGEV